MQAAGCAPNRHLYTGIRFCLEKVGQKDEALALDRRKGGSGGAVSGDDLGRVLERLGRQGRLQEALSRFEEARQAKGQLPARVWTKMMEACAR
jgi:hypothetical protein